ncbi:MAG: beta strand repeat-containing protein [Vulcanimicrobiaceae bacterium]
MKKDLRGLLALPLLVAVFAVSMMRPATMPASAATPPPASTPNPTPTSSTAPGTAINNTATASYSDGTNTYSTTSNQVQTFVQNAPSVVITTNNGTSPGALSQNQNTPQGPIAYNDIIGDAYTLTNTGNSSGYFQLGGGTSTVTGSGTFQNVIVTGMDGVAHTFATVAAANTYLSTPANTDVYGLAPGAYINVTVQYKVTTAGTGTVGTTVAGATITYPGTGTNYGASTSNAVSNTYTDTVVSDARLDMQKAAGTIAGNNLTYTIDVNNGGSAPAQLLQSIRQTGTTITGSAFSSTNNGILVSDKIPLNAGNPLTISSVNITKNISIAGDTATIVYTTDSTGKTGWTTTAPAAGTAYFAGAYIGGTAPIPAGSGGSSAGNVTNAQAQLEFTITLSGLPSGTVVKNDATTAYADNAGFVEGPNITPYTVTNNGTADPSVSYTTAVGGSAGNGLSNTTTSNVPGVLNGPKANAGATGCYNTSVCGSNTNNTDFTEASLGTGGTFGAQLAGGTVVNVPGDLQNTSGSNDTYSFTFPGLPAGVTVTGVYTDYACTNLATKDASNNFQIAVSSGATAAYCVKYTSVSGASATADFTPVFVQVAATSQASGSYANSTYHVLMPGGFISLQKTATVVSTGCPSGATVPANGVCPSGVIQYKVVYANALPVTSGTGNTTLAMAAGSLQITEDGGSGSNTWATYTNGLREVLITGASATNQCGIAAGTCGDTATGSIYAAVGSTSTPNNNGNAIASNAFVDTVGGAAFVLAPQTSGTLYFAVIVK